MSKARPTSRRRPPRQAITKMKAPVRVSVSRFRLLPLTIIMSVLLFGVKVSDIYHTGSELNNIWHAREAYAEDAKPAADAKTTEAPATDAKPVAEGDKPADAVKTDAAAPAATTETNKAEGTHDATSGEVKTASLPATPEPSPTEPKHEYTQIELDILQSLSERRSQLDKRAEDIDLKEKLLEATELRVNDKLSEIKGLKTQVETLLKEYTQHEDQKVAGLVKIYETMKPKDAAVIFNQLDMPIMLLVVDRMSSRKVAPVLAGMDPAKARDLTIELAEYRRLKAMPQTVSADPGITAAPVPMSAPSTPTSAPAAPAQ